MYTWTAFCLHGFNSNGEEFKFKLMKSIPLEIQQNIDFIFLKAPLINITCYNDDRYRAWHDYYSDFASIGRSDKEELINNDDLYNLRTYVQKLISHEIKNNRKVLVLGESQGGCCALDICLSFKEYEIPCIVFYGHKYSVTPIYSSPPVYMFHSTNDNIINISLTKKSIENISNVNLSICQNYHHSQFGPKTNLFIEHVFNSLMKRRPQ